MENRTGRFDRKDVFRAGLVEHARFEGMWEMPVIPSSSRIPDRLLPFDHALSRDRFDSFVHFYIDDERSERIWKRPGDYFARLKKFQGVISPDFSLYRDLPLGLQVWNTYRSRALGHWLARGGIEVIPQRPLGRRAELRLLLRRHSAGEARCRGNPRLYPPQRGPALFPAGTGGHAGAPPALRAHRIRAGARFAVPAVQRNRRPASPIRQHAAGGSSPGGRVMGGGMSGGGDGYFKGTKGAKGNRNTAVHEGRQGKHIPGHNNYIQGRSIFYGTAKEAQELIDQYAGTGTKISADKERVDFGKIIGKYHDRDTGKYYDTTIGIIHYSKDGTHIVPQKPNNWEEIK